MIFRLDQQPNPQQPKKEETEQQQLHECPMCSLKFSLEVIHEHAYSCQGPVEPRSTR